MVASVRRARLTPGSTDEAVRRVREGFAPIIKGMPGFVAYYVVDVGDGALVTVTVFADRASAEETNRVAADWAKRNLGQWMTSPLEFATGEVVVHEFGELEVADRFRPVS